MSQKDDYLGYIKIKGVGVEDGIISARASGNALLGFDNALRYFTLRTHPDVSEVNYEIPVRIQKGSWEALIPHTVVGWVNTSAGLAISAYATTASRKLADNGFKDKDLSDTLRDGIKAMQSVIKIAKHVGSLTKRKELKVKFDGENASISNNDGFYLHVTRKEVEHYLKCPDDLLSDLIEAVNADQALLIGEIEDDGKVNEVKVEYSERRIFTTNELNEQGEDILFPELMHGEYVDLEGDVTRVNKIENTLGFAYQGHILTCKPFENLPIASFLKHELFPHCYISGVVSRRNNDETLDSHKPKIIFNKLEIIEKNSDGDQISLL